MIRRIIRILLRIVIGLVVLSIGMTLLYRWVPVPYTPLMFIRYVEKKSSGEEAAIRHHWVPLASIPNALQLAVVCGEDQNFLRHSGFDWGAIQKARKSNERGGPLRGASTISQQTAKNVFLWPGRTFLRKGLEVYFTFLIETFWSKQRIMEVYLNSIEMGDGVYGADAAARYWFSKPAEKLTSGQSAAIAAILPNPRAYSASRPGPYTLGRRDWILYQMRLWGNKLDYNKEK